MERIRFEVILNQDRLCIAGVDGYGVLTAIITMAAQKKSDPPGSENSKGVIQYEITFDVRGLECNDSDENHYLTWIYRLLKEGDEVRIRVLPDGEHNPPVLACLDHASACVKEGDCISEDEHPGFPSPESETRAVRFECWFNGQPLCIAGLDGEGVVAAIVSAVTRHPEFAKKYHEDGESSKDALHMGIQGLDSRPESRSQLVWISGKMLRTGDEVRMRLLPPGAYDPPKRITSTKLE